MAGLFVVDPYDAPLPDTGPDVYARIPGVPALGGIPGGMEVPALLDPSPARHPRPHGPDLYTNSAGQFYLNGTVFDAEDADMALRTEPLLAEQGTGVRPAGSDWQAVDPVSYGSFLESIKNPTLTKLVKKNFGRGVDISQMLGGRLMQFAGADETGQRVVDAQMEDLRRTSPYERMFTDIGSDPNRGVLDWFVANLAQQGPNIIESALTAGAGSALGGLAGATGVMSSAGGHLMRMAGKQEFKQAVLAAAKKHAAGETLDAAESKLLREAAGITAAGQIKAARVAMLGEKATRAPTLGVQLARHRAVPTPVGTTPLQQQINALTGVTPYPSAARGIAARGAVAERAASWAKAGDLAAGRAAGVATKGGINQARTAGAAAATLAQNYGMGIADIYGESIEAGDPNREAAAALGIPYALLESSGEFLLAMKVFGNLGRSNRLFGTRSTTGMTLGGKALEYARRGAVGGTVGGMTEGGTEAGQELLLLDVNEDVDWDSPEGMNRLINSFAAGFGVGGPIGTLGGLKGNEPTNLLKPGVTTAPVRGAAGTSNRPTPPATPTTPAIPAAPPAGGGGGAAASLATLGAGMPQTQLPLALENPNVPYSPWSPTQEIAGPQRPEGLNYPNEQQGALDFGATGDQLDLFGGASLPNILPGGVPGAEAALAQTPNPAQGALQFAPPAPTGTQFEGAAAPETALGQQLEQAQRQQAEDAIYAQRAAELAAAQDQARTRAFAQGEGQQQLNLIPPTPAPIDQTLANMPMRKFGPRQPQQGNLFSPDEAPKPSRAERLRRGMPAPVRGEPTYAQQVAERDALFQERAVLERAIATKGAKFTKGRINAAKERIKEINKRLEQLPPVAPADTGQMGLWTSAGNPTVAALRGATRGLVRQDVTNRGEQDNAVQERSTTPLDARQQTGNGKRLGKRNTSGQAARTRETLKGKGKGKEATGQQGGTPQADVGVTQRPKGEAAEAANLREGDAAAGVVEHPFTKGKGGLLKYTTLKVKLRKEPGKVITLKDGSQITLHALGDANEGEIIALDSKGNQIGNLDYSKRYNEEGKPFNPSTGVDKKWQRKGVATAMYDLAEALGGKIATNPENTAIGGLRSNEAKAFHAARERTKAARGIQPTNKELHELYVKIAAIYDKIEAIYAKHATRLRDKPMPDKAHAEIAKLEAEAAPFVEQAKELRKGNINPEAKKEMDDAIARAEASAADADSFANRLLAAVNAATADTETAEEQAARQKELAEAEAAAEARDRAEAEQRGKLAKKGELAQEVLDAAETIENMTHRELATKAGRVNYVSTLAELMLVLNSTDANLIRSGAPKFVEDFLTRVPKNALYREAILMAAKTSGTVKGMIINKKTKEARPNSFFALITTSNMYEAVKDVATYANLPPEYATASTMPSTERTGREGAEARNPPTGTEASEAADSKIKAAKALSEEIRSINRSTTRLKKVAREARIANLEKLWEAVENEGTQDFIDENLGVPLSSYFEEGAPKINLIKGKMQVATEKISDEKRAEVETALDTADETDDDVYDPRNVLDSWQFVGTSRQTDEGSFEDVRSERAETADEAVEAEERAAKERIKQANVGVKADLAEIAKQFGLKQPKGRYFRDDGQPLTRIVAPGRVKMLVSTILSRLSVAPKVYVYKNQADLKAQNPALYARAVAQRPQGDFDTTSAVGYSFMNPSGSSEVILFSDRAATEKLVKFVLAHEILGHHGFRAVLPAKEFNAVMHAVYDTRWDPLESTCRHASLSIL